MDNLADSKTVSTNGVLVLASLAMIGWFAKTSYTNHRELAAEHTDTRGNQVRIAATLETAVDKLGELQDDVVVLGRSVNDHERRLARREDNAFLASDGAELANRVSDNSRLIAKLAETVRAIRDDLTKHAERLRAVWGHVRTATPEGQP